MKRIDAQEWLNEKFPLEIRNEITHLDISKGKTKINLTKLKIQRNVSIHGKLKLVGFLNLKVLKCSFQALKFLDLSECKSLEILNCSNNEISEIKFDGCSNLKVIDCSDNKIKKLNLIDLFSLEMLNILKNNFIEEINIQNCFNLNIENFKYSSIYNYDHSQGKLIFRNEVKNILIIGPTGSGKSTFANTLIGPEEEKFEESSSTNSKTKISQIEDLVYKNNSYNIIDTVGIGDTNISKEEVIEKLETISQVIINNGINQIFFVTNGRLTKEVLSYYLLLKEVIFDENVNNFTTLVRTNFSNFNNVKKCQDDIEDLLKGELMSSLFNKHRIIHVDNPQIDVDDESDREYAIRRRSLSRLKILNYIDEKCQVRNKVRLLKGFKQIIDEFKWDFLDITEIIKDIELNFLNYNLIMSNYIKKREEIIRFIEKNQRDLKETMNDRYLLNTAGNTVMLSGKILLLPSIWFPPLLVPALSLSVIGWTTASSSDAYSVYKENDLYKYFINLIEEDDNNYEILNKTKLKIYENIDDWKRKYHYFNKSEYKRLKINEEKIETIEEINKWFNEEKKDIEVSGKVEAEKSHSLGWKTIRAIAEATAKAVPSPLSFYLIYRDGKEIEDRSSIKDIGSIVNEFRSGIVDIKLTLFDCEIAYNQFKKLISEQRNLNFDNLFFDRELSDLRENIEELNLYCMEN